MMTMNGRNIMTTSTLAMLLTLCHQNNLYPKTINKNQCQNIILNSPGDGETYSDSIRNAINKSINFFKNKKNIDAQAYLLLDYLIRKYEIPFSVDTSDINKAFNKNLNYTFQIFCKIIDPKIKLPVNIPDTFNNPMDQCVLRAFLCSERPVDEKFLDYLSEQIKTGKYPLTHAVIALQWLKEKQCMMNEKRINELIHNSIQPLLHLAAAEKYSTDLGIESMAVLCYSDNQKKIKRYMISKVAEAQKENGAWGHEPKSDFSDEHTTVLALWLMLSIEHPHINPSTKWIVK